MMFTTKFSLSNIHVRLTAKGLLRNLQLLSGCKRTTVVFRAVDKTKARPCVRDLNQNQNLQKHQRQVNGHGVAAPGCNSKTWGLEQYRAQCEIHAKARQDLKSLLQASNLRFEAVSIAFQHYIAKHGGTLKTCEELSQELVNLREDLVTSVQQCEHLEQEKEELRTAFDGVLMKAQEQHCTDLADLEERLRVFYAAEWDKVHQVYQEEADKCKAQMEQQLESLKSEHAALRQELESSHAEKMESIKQQYEQSLEELRESHEAEMQSLDKVLKATEVKFTDQIEDLKMENTALNEKLYAAGQKEMEMADDSQKDSHTLYLEQELESLKVVLDIKNQQLHQQDKKLMQMDKLLERNVKLDESLQRIQQENEDLKARMDRHMALSRQLSTEQAVLQESLLKESTVNKRLSMENEELLWKLHNGDLGSPRKLSPSAPTMGLPIQSPSSEIQAFSSAHLFHPDNLGSMLP